MVKVRDVEERCHHQLQQPERLPAVRGNYKDHRTRRIRRGLLPVPGFEPVRQRTVEHYSPSEGRHYSANDGRVHQRDGAGRRRKAVHDRVLSDQVLPEADVHLGDRHGRCRPDAEALDSGQKDPDR